MSCCNTKIINIGGTGSGGGPFNVTSVSGVATITDTASGNTFDIDVCTLGRMCNFLMDDDGDTGLELVESGAAAGGGDRMDFIVDGVVVGSVEFTGGGLSKWTLSDIVDPILFVGNRTNCTVATANTTAVQGALYVSDGTDGFTAGQWIKVENGVCSELSTSASGSIDYITNVMASGTSLVFSGVGNAFNGIVALPSSQNITNADLTADANHTQDFANFNQVWNNANDIEFNANNDVDITGTGSVNIASDAETRNEIQNIGDDVTEIVLEPRDINLRTLNDSSGFESRIQLQDPYLRVEYDSPTGNPVAVDLKDGAVTGAPQIHLESAAVTGATAANGQVFTLIDALTGEGEWQTAPGVNIIEVDASAAAQPQILATASGNNDVTLFHVSCSNSGGAITSVDTVVGVTDFSQVGDNSILMAVPGQVAPFAATGATVAAIQPDSAPNTVPWSVVPGVVDLQRGPTGGFYNTNHETEWDSNVSTADCVWAWPASAADVANGVVWQGFQDAFDGAVGTNIVNGTSLMFVPSTGQIFEVTANSWQSGGGGGFDISATEVLKQPAEDGWCVVQLNGKNYATADLTADADHVHNMGDFRFEENYYGSRGRKTFNFHRDEQTLEVLMDYNDFDITFRDGQYTAQLDMDDDEFDVLMRRDFPNGNTVRGALDIEEDTVELECRYDNNVSGTSRRSYVDLEPDSLELSKTGFNTTEIRIDLDEHGALSGKEGQLRLRIQENAMVQGTAASGHVLTLLHSGTGECEWRPATGGVNTNITNSNHVATGSYVQDFSGFNQTWNNVGTFDVNANTDVGFTVGDDFTVDATDNISLTAGETAEARMDVSSGDDVSEVKVEDLDVHMFVLSDSSGLQSEVRIQETGVDINYQDSNINTTPTAIRINNGAVTNACQIHLATHAVASGIAPAAGAVFTLLDPATGEGEWQAAVSGAAADTNYANNNLTADANRTHIWAGNILAENWDNNFWTRSASFNTINVNQNGDDNIVAITDSTTVMTATSSGGNIAQVRVDSVGPQAEVLMQYTGSGSLPVYFKLDSDTVYIKDSQINASGAMMGNVLTLVDQLTGECTWQPAGGGANINVVDVFTDLPFGAFTHNDLYLVRSQGVLLQASGNSSLETVLRASSEQAVVLPATTVIDADVSPTNVGLAWQAQTDTGPGPYNINAPAGIPGTSSLAIYLLNNTAASVDYVFNTIYKDDGGNDIGTVTVGAGLVRYILFTGSGDPAFSADEFRALNYDVGGSSLASGVNIYTSDGAIQDTLRTVDMSGNDLLFDSTAGGNFDVSIDGGATTGTLKVNAGTAHIQFEDAADIVHWKADANSGAAQLFARTRNISQGAATAGQVLTLISAADGECEWTTVSGGAAGQNLFDANDTLGASRTHDLGGFGISFNSAISTADFTIDVKDFTAPGSNILSVNGAAAVLGHTVANSFQAKNDGLELNVSGNGDLEINGDPGTAGQVLTSNGNGLPPTWEDAAGASGVSNLYLADGTVVSNRTVNVDNKVLGFADCGQFAAISNAIADTGVPRVYNILSGSGFGGPSIIMGWETAAAAASDHGMQIDDQGVALFAVDNGSSGPGITLNSSLSTGGADLKIRTPGLGGASNGDVLTLVDNTDGGCEWQAAGGTSAYGALERVSTSVGTSLHTVASNGGFNPASIGTTANRLQFTNADANLENNITIGTNVITIDEAGDYRIVGITSVSMSTQTYIHLQLVVNGLFITANSGEVFSNNAFDNVPLSINHLMTLSATDTVEFRVNGTNTQTISVDQIIINLEKIG